MSEVTAVPLRPIAKGTLYLLWFGILALIGAGAAFAYWTSGTATTASGLRYQEVRAGAGEHPTTEDVVLVKYEGRLPDGTVFDKSDQAPLRVTGVIPGWTEALQLMRKGGKYRIWVPAKLAYGEKGSPPTIPPNTDLTFDIELIDFVAESVLMQQMQMQGMMGGGGGMPGGGMPGGDPHGGLGGR